MTTLVLWLSLASTAQAPAPELADGIRLVDEGDLEGAVGALEAALARLATDDGAERQRALGHLYLGMALLGLERPGEARASVQEAWRLNRGARLDPRRFPPRLVSLYEEVGREARPPANGPKRAKLLLPAAVGALVGAGAASLGGSTAAPPAAPPQAPPPPPVTVRLFNNDDAGRAFVGGTLVREVGLGEDTGPLDVTLLLSPGPNEIAFELVNAHGGISYGFEVRLGDAIVFQETCGIVFRAGCENDRKFPPGVIRRFTYVVQR
jgi:hypothetical protein